MKNSYKRFAVLFMVFILVFGMLACNKTPSNGPTGAAKVKITVGLSSKIADFDNNALTTWLEEKCNVELVFKDFYNLHLGHQSTMSVATAMEDVDILWGAQFGDEAISSYGREGYFVDLRSYYEDKDGISKIFWERLGELSTSQQGQVIREITDPENGAMYAVPTVKTYLTDGIYGMAWINQTWLDKLGLKAPTNTDELYTVLKAFKENDCNGNGDKTDEIPLFGSQNTASPAHVINWLVNMFIYYNEEHPWQDYNGDGQIEQVYTQDAYRDALKFANRLYEEKLLTSMVFNASSGDMKGMITPSSNVAQCGIFLGDLIGVTTYNSEILYEYVALPVFGCATEEDISCMANCFITEHAAKTEIADRCFELLMTMWSAEGSLRIRYGEYGVNWTDATAGAKTASGIAAEVKVLDDPAMKESAANWGKTTGTFLRYAGGENIQTDDSIGKWELTVLQMQGQARTYFDQAEKNINPTFLADPFRQTFKLKQVEQKEIGTKPKNLNDVVNTYMQAFVTGDKNMNVDNDAHWQKFIDELMKEGYEDVRAMYQKYYEKNQ